MKTFYYTLIEKADNVPHYTESCSILATDKNETTRYQLHSLH